MYVVVVVVGQSLAGRSHLAVILHVVQLEALVTSGKGTQNSFQLSCRTSSLTSVKMNSHSERCHPT